MTRPVKLNLNGPWAKQDWAREVIINHALDLYFKARIKNGRKAFARIARRILAHRDDFKPPKVERSILSRGPTPDCLLSSTDWYLPDSPNAPQNAVGGTDGD